MGAPVITSSILTNLAELFGPAAISFRRPPGLPRHHVDHEPRGVIMTATQWTADNAGAGRYADVNGINLYYETHGTGRPLVLLHGGLGSGEMFGPVLGDFAADHQVILPDLQAHGRTPDIDRPLETSTMSD